MLRLAFASAQPLTPGAAPALSGYRVHIRKERVRGQLGACKHPFISCCNSCVHGQSVLAVANSVKRCVCEQLDVFLGVCGLGNRARRN